MIENPNSKSHNYAALVLEWQKNPVLAAKDILGVRLEPLQEIVLMSRWKHDSEIDVLSRGCGKTFLNAVFSVLRAMLLPGHRVGLIAPSFRQSKMMFAEIEKLYQKSPMFQEACLRDPVKSADSCSITFKAAQGFNGSFIEALPLGTDGAKIRGARYYDVVADEGAQIDDNILNTVVRGFLATSSDPIARAEYFEECERKIAAGEMTEADIVNPENNKFIISSTAFFQYNHLWTRVSAIIKEVMQEYKQLQRDGKDTSHIKLLGGPLNGGQIPFRVMSNGRTALTAFTYLDPRRGFMNKKTIEDARRDMSPYLFSMEYEAYFPPDSEGFFRRSDLDKCRTHCEFSCLEGPRRGMLYTMGIDPARSGDNFAIAIWEVDVAGATCNLVRVMAWNKKEFTVMHREVRKLIREFGITYFQMDAGGGGTTVRDLLASRENCPIGEDLILEQGFDEHRVKTGKRLLGPLVQFSSGDWVRDANYNLLSSIQHGHVKIAAKPGSGGEVWTPMKEDMDKEMEETLVEMSSIVMSTSGSRQKWDTPTDTMRKDRYSAVLIGHDAALKVLNSHNKPKSLPLGGWAG